MRGRGQVLGLVIDHPQHIFPNTQLISVSSFFRNYVFQRRFVQFNGRSLMYFGSDKDPFPKGVIPLTAIEMTRSSKDNKFQVITGQRVFVFRSESEGEDQSPLG